MHAQMHACKRECVSVCGWGDSKWCFPFLHHSCSGRDIWGLDIGVDEGGSCSDILVCSQWLYNFVSGGKGEA